MNDTYRKYFRASIVKSCICWELWLESSVDVMSAHWTDDVYIGTYWNEAEAESYAETVLDSRYLSTVDVGHGRRLQVA